MRSLVVLLLDHEPGREEILRIQAQANRSEELALVDQQAQFGDCWQARAGLPEADRIAAVCADLGISPKKAHNLRRQLTLPEAIRARVAERPPGTSCRSRSPTASPTCTRSRPRSPRRSRRAITTSELHDGALRDLGAFVHRTLVEDEHAYAVRIDDGALLDAVEQIARARAQLTAGRPATARRDPRLPGRQARRRARRARRPRQDDGVQAARRRRAARTRRAPAATPTCTSAAPTSPPASGSSTRCSCSTRSASSSKPATARSRASRATSPAPASTTPSCARPASRTARSAPTRAPARSRRRARTSGSATTCAPA